MSFSVSVAEMKAEIRKDILKLVKVRFLYQAHDVTDKWKLSREWACALGFDVFQMRFGAMTEEQVVEKWFIKRVKSETGLGERLSLDEERLNRAMDKQNRTMLAELEKLKVKHGNEADAKSLCIAELENLKVELANQTHALNLRSVEHENLKVELANQTHALNLRSVEHENLKVELANQTRALNLRNAELGELKAELGNQTRAKILYSAEFTYFSRCDPSITQNIQNVANLHDAVVEEMTNPRDACAPSVFSAIEREAACARPPPRDPEPEHCLVSNKLVAVERLQHEVLSAVKSFRPAEEQEQGEQQEEHHDAYLRADMLRALPTKGPFAPEDEFINDAMATTVCDVIETLRANNANVEDYARTRGDEEALFVQQLALLWGKMQVEEAYRPGELDERGDKAMELLQWFYSNFDCIKSGQLVPIITAAMDTITSHRDSHRQRNLEALAAHQTAAEHARAMIAALSAFASDKAHVVVDVARENAHQKSRRKEELQQAAAQIEDGYRRMLDVVKAQQNDAHRLSLCKAEEAASEEIRRTWQAEEELQTRLLTRAKDGDDFVGRFHAWYVAASKEMMRAAQANVTLQRTLVARDPFKMRALGSALLEQVIDQKQATQQSIHVMHEMYAQKQEEWRAFVNSQDMEEGDANRNMLAAEKRVDALEKQLAKLEERHAAIEGLLAAYENKAKKMRSRKKEEGQEENDEEEKVKDVAAAKTAAEEEGEKDKEERKEKEAKNETKIEEENEKAEEEVYEEDASKWIRSFFPRAPLNTWTSSEKTPCAKPALLRDASNCDFESRSSCYTDSYIKV